MAAVERPETRRHPRRKRHDSEDGTHLHKQPARKRTRLNPGAASADGDASPEVASPKANGHGKTSEDTVVAIRPGRAPQARDDAVTTLVDKFAITRLPHSKVDFEAKLDCAGLGLSRHGYVLTVTHTEAIIWDVAGSSAVRTFALTNAAKSREPVPLGAFVEIGAAHEIGLVVVNATNGKVSYWENIDNADALNLFEKRRNGAEGSCGNLFSGETVTAIEPLGAAGFVLSFSSGRAAQLTVRDTQSRAAISVTFLKDRNAPSGFLGGLKSVFGASVLKTLAGIRTRPLQVRDHVELLQANEDALFQYWQLSWATQPLLSRQVDAKDALAVAAEAAFPDAKCSAKLIDFAIVSDSPSETDLLLLVHCASNYESVFALVEVDIQEDELHPRRAIPLDTYLPLGLPTTSWRPRLLVPTPHHSAFVIFERAITIVSLLVASHTPETQLLADVGRLPDPVQDTTYLNEGRTTVTGAAPVNLPDKRQSSSIAVLIAGSGAVRVQAEKPTKSWSRLPAVEIRSKLEQAVFFGSVPSTPLDLARKPEVDFAGHELEHAALDISHDILSSESPFIVSLAVHMGDHLASRAQHLNNLIVQVRRWADVSIATRWKLRWDAEKLTAVRQLWSQFDQLMGQRWKEMRIFPETLLIMNESEKTVLDKKLGEMDRVRLWCTKDVWRAGAFFEWVLNALEVLYRDGKIRDWDKYLSLIGEANDALIGGLGAAYTFREEHAERYGLEDAANDFRGPEEPWTSTMRMLVQVQVHFQRMVDVIQKRTQEVEARAITEDLREQDLESEQVIDKVIVDCLQLVDAYCRGFEEHLAWLGAQPDAEAKADAARLAYKRSRRAMFTELRTTLEASDQAADLAEKYEDLDALVDYIDDEADEIRKFARLPETEGKSRQLEAARDERVAHYFEEFGAAWADALFGLHVQNRQFATLLDCATTARPHVARFVGDRAGRARLRWIWDVLGEHNEKAAANALMHVAQEQETALWSKKVELSLAKLAIMCSHQDEAATAMLADQADGMALVRIEEQLYEHVLPFLYDAVDEPAELQLAMETFGRHTAAAPALAQLLERGLEHLIAHRAMTAEQLVDVLTLMAPRSCSVRAADICGRETYLALAALKHGGPQRTRQHFETMQRLIWKRCFIADDWESINRTGNKGDDEAVADLESTALFKTLALGTANDLWDATIKLPAARDCLGAGASADDYAPRFAMADIRTGLARDVRDVQDAALAAHVEQHQLEKWIEATSALAARRAREAEEAREAADAEAAHEAEADARERREALEATGYGAGEANGNGHGNANGNGNGNGTHAE